jgi:hypothetical protein
MAAEGFVVHDSRDIFNRKILSSRMAVDLLKIQIEKELIEMKISSAIRAKVAKKITLIEGLEKLYERALSNPSNELLEMIHSMVDDINRFDSIDETLELKKQLAERNERFTALNNAINRVEEGIPDTRVIVKYILRMRADEGGCKK